MVHIGKQSATTFSLETVGNKLSSLSEIVLHWGLPRLNEEVLLGARFIV